MSFVFSSTPRSRTPEPIPAWWFVFNRGRLLIHIGDRRTTIPCLEDFSRLNLQARERQYLGELQEKPCYAVEVAAPGELPPDLEFSELRPLYGRLEPDLFQAAGCALQVLGWDQSHQFCGRCGAPTVLGTAERVKQCPSCGLVNYPRISPAIIVAVTKGPRILLARSYRFKNNMYSVLAGYLELGETLEDCVRREVREEVGLALKNIRYFGSQSWAFSNALMVAYTAEYAGGEITIDGVEICEAAWFAADALPRIPESLSIARRLIDWFVEHHAQL